MLSRRTSAPPGCRSEQDVQAVDAPGVLGDQVVATLGEQTQDRGVVLELDVVEAPVVLGDRGD